MAKRSMSRFQYREMERKVIPSIKLLSQYMHNTSPEAPKKDFHGYEVPAGIFTDGHGVTWQVKIQAVCSKGLFVNENEIKPIIRKWALLFKVRLFAKVLIDKIFGE